LTSFENNTQGVRLGVGASFDDNTSALSGHGLDVRGDEGVISGEVVWNLKSDYSLYGPAT
jgi:hypothetical protein